MEITDRMLSSCIVETDPDRFQFFEPAKFKAKHPRWMQRYFLDRQTQTVYLPVCSERTQILALMDDERILANGKPYCRLRTYAAHLPELRAGLLGLEERVIRHAEQHAPEGFGFLKCKTKPLWR